MFGKAPLQPAIEPSAKNQGAAAAKLGAGYGKVGVAGKRPLQDQYAKGTGQRDCSGSPVKRATCGGRRCNDRLIAGSAAMRQGRRRSPPDDFDWALNAVVVSSAIGRS